MSIDTISISNIGKKTIEHAAHKAEDIDIASRAMRRVSIDELNEGESQTTINGAIA
jgi:hypothetical protein